MRLIAFIAALTAISIPAWADDTFQCLDTFTGPLNDIDGEQPLANYDFFNLGDGARFDARTATIYSQTVDPSDYTVNATPYINYPVDIREPYGTTCWAGGAHVSKNPADITWAESKFNRNSAAIIVTGGSIVDGVRVHNQHDGIRPRRSTEAFWEVRNSWFSYNRDDCIENDFFASGLIEDSLFDGCYVFLSSRNKSDIPNNSVVTVQNSVVHLQKMPGPAKWNDRTLYGHGALFKWDPQGPALNLHDNVFMIDQMPTTQGSLKGHPSNAFGTIGFLHTTYGAKLNECSGNVIVWLGDGDQDGDFTDDDFPGDIPDDPNCVTVTRDVTVWHNARDEWLVSHPNVARISGVDDPVVVAPTSDSTTTADSGSTTTDGNLTNDVAEFGDTEPPSVTLLSPANLVLRKSDQLIEVAANDDTGILRIEISIDGLPYAVLENNWSVNWTVPANPNGSYEIAATAIDLSGNYSTYLEIIQPSRSGYSQLVKDHEKLTAITFIRVLA